MTCIPSYFLCSDFNFYKLNILLDVFCNNIIDSTISGKFINSDIYTFKQSVVFLRNAYSIIFIRICCIKNNKTFVFICKSLCWFIVYYNTVNISAKKSENSLVAVGITNNVIFSEIFSSKCIACCRKLNSYLVRNPLCIKIINCFYRRVFFNYDSLYTVCIT